MNRRPRRPDLNSAQLTSCRADTAKSVHSNLHGSSSLQHGLHVGSNAQRRCQLNRANFSPDYQTNVVAPRQTPQSCHTTNAAKNSVCVQWMLQQLQFNIRNMKRNLRAFSSICSECYCVSQSRFYKLPSQAKKQCFVQQAVEKRISRRSEYHLVDLRSERGV